MGFVANHVHIKTPDPQKTAQWYVEFLGAKVTSENRYANGKMGFRLDLHGVPLNVTDFIDGQKLDQHYGIEHLALDTDDFDGQVGKITAGGAKILEERTAPNGTRICFFEAPGGARLELMEMQS